MSDTPTDSGRGSVTDEPSCETCGCFLEWQECWECEGDRYSEHDCDEDCPCCVWPEHYVLCPSCENEGGYWMCPNAKSHQKGTPMRDLADEDFPF